MVKSRAQLLSYIVFLTQLSGCTSLSFRIESEPTEAEVYLIRSQFDPVPLGKTPFTLSKDQMPEAFKENVEIKVGKDGYESSLVLIPDSFSGANHQLSVTLKPDRICAACIDRDAALNKISHQIVEAQAAIYKKDFQTGMRVLLSLTESFPSVAILYSLIGNVEYLLKDFEKAKFYYTKALNLDPQDKNIAHMLERLNTVNGIQPARGVK